MWHAKHARRPLQRAEQHEVEKLLDALPDKLQRERFLNAWRFHFAVSSISNPVDFMSSSAFAFLPVDVNGSVPVRCG